MCAANPSRMTAAVPSATRAPSRSRSPSSGRVTPRSSRSGGRQCSKARMSVVCSSCGIQVVDRRGGVEEPGGPPDQLRRIRGEQRERRAHQGRPAALDRIEGGVVESVHQLQADLRAPGRQGRLRGGQQSGVPQRARWGQLRRLREHVGARRVAAPLTGPVGDSLEPPGHRGIRPDLRLGGVPGLEIGQSQIGGCRGQRAVGAPALRTRRLVVDRGADQRMPEPDHLVQIDQPGPVGGISRPGGDADLAGRPADRARGSRSSPRPRSAARSGPSPAAAAPDGRSAPRVDGPPGAVRPPGSRR